MGHDRWRIFELYFYCWYLLSGRQILLLGRPRVGATIDNFTLQDYLGVSHSLERLARPPGDRRRVSRHRVPAGQTLRPAVERARGRVWTEGCRLCRHRLQRAGLAARVGHYARVHKIDFPFLKDVAAKVADQFGRRTPEAFVLDSKVASSITVGSTTSLASATNDRRGETRVGDRAG